MEHRWCQVSLCRRSSVKKVGVERGGVDYHITDMRICPSTFVARIRSCHLKTGVSTEAQQLPRCIVAQIFIPMLEKKRGLHSEQKHDDHIFADPDRAAGPRRAV